MAVKPKSRHFLVLLIGIIIAGALWPRPASAKPPFAYGLYSGKKEKAAKDPRKGFVAVTLHKDNKLEGRSEGVFVMPPGSYCGKDGKFSFVLRRTEEFSYQMKFEGDIEQSSGSFAVQAKGIAVGKPVIDTKGAQRVEVPLDGVFKGKAQKEELEGELVLSARNCGMGKWVRNGFQASTIKPGSDGKGTSFDPKAQRGNLIVNTTHEIRKKANGPITYLRREARFTWKTKDHEKGGLLPWRYLEGDASIYTKNGFKNPGSKVCNVPGCLYWTFCGKKPRVNQFFGEVEGAYCIDGNDDGKTAKFKLKLHVPHWGQYYQTCKGAGGIALVAILGSGGGWAKYKETFRWQPSGQDKKLAEVDKLHYKAKLQKTKITVCPRLNQNQAEGDPPAALIFAHPDFPARLELYLPASYSVEFSLPPGSQGTLSTGDASKAAKGPLQIKAGKLNGKMVKVYYRHGSQPAEPLSGAVTDLVTVKIFDPDEKQIEEQEVAVKIGLGLHLDRFRLIQAAPEDSTLKRVEHAFLLSMKSKLNPKLDLEWYQNECDSCRQGLTAADVDTLMPGAVRLHLMAGWFNNQGLPTTRNELNIFSGQLQVAKNKSSGAFQMAPGKPHWQQKKEYSGPIWVKEKGEEVTVYPAIDQYKQGYFVLQARTRPLMDGKMVPLTESSLDRYKYLMAAYDSPESYYQSLACALQPRDLSQLILLETLKLIPAYGSKVKWGILLPSKVICLLTQGKEDEAFFELMKAGAEKLVETAVFKGYTPGKLRSLCDKYNLPNVTDADIQGMNSALEKAYKIAKSKYKIWSKSGKLPPKQNQDGRLPETQPPAEQDITSDLLKGMTN